MANREVNLTKRVSPKESKRRKGGGIAASCYLLMDVSSPTLW